MNEDKRLDYQEIKIKSPYEILALQNLEIIAQVNEHVMLTFSAVVSEEKGKEHVTKSKHTDKIEIEQYKDGEFVRLLFIGQLYSINVEARNDVHHLNVKALSYTYDMDIERKRRSYQEPSMTYEAMIGSIIKDYDSPDFFPIACEGKAIDIFTLQYDETDWEFTKRMASRFESVLTPEGRHDSPKFWFGLPDGDDFELDKTDYSVTKALNPYRDSTENYDADVEENDFITYEIESQFYMYLGDNVIINGITSKVAKSTLTMEEGVLRLRYALMPKDGIRHNLIKNRRITGLAIEGTVIGRKADEIKIKLDIDKNYPNPDCGERWFKYESNYTVGDDWGWYVMPEMGHFVALFMPDELEEHAHAVRSIRRNGDEHPKTQDPTIKILGTHHYKELRMDNEQLKFTVLNNEKTNRFMHLRMKEGKGIEILSDRGIDVYTKSDLSIFGHKVKLRAENSIIFNNQEGSIVMDGITHYYNSKIDKKANPEGELELQASKKAAIFRSVAGFKTLGTKGKDMGQTEACADPVDIATGNYYIEQTDMILRGKYPINFVRFFNALDDYTGPLGKNWHHSFDIKLIRSSDKATIIWGDGRREDFTVLKSGAILPDGGNNGQTIERADDGGYVLKSYKGITHIFDSEGRFVELNDKDNIIKLQYNETDKSLPTSISSKSGTLTLSYTNGILRKISDPLGRYVDYNYDNGALASVRNINGGKTFYEYDSDYQITKVTDPNGNTMVENIYDQQGRIIEQTMPMGSKVFFAYDDEAATTTFTERNDEKTVYQKDSNGRIVKKQTAAGIEKMSFDAGGNLISFTDKNGGSYHYKSFRTDSDTGAPRSVIAATKPNGDTSETIYDDNGNIISEKYPDGSLHKDTYKNAEQIESYTDPLGHMTKFEYDNQDNLISLILPDGSKKEYTHDDRGNILTYQDGEGNITNLAYDQGNRMISYTKPLNNKTSYGHNDIDKITQVSHPDGTSIKRAYDYCGLLKEEIDEAGGVLSYEYHPNGKISKKTDALGGVTIYEYDVMDNLIAVTNPDGSQKQYRYDEMGRRTVEIDEEGGKRHFFYDANENIIKEADQNGNATRYEYDSLNRVIKEIDASNNETSYKYNHDDKIIRKTDAMGGVTENQYDLCGRLVSTTSPIGATTKYEYNKMGYMIKEINPYGAETLYEHNSNGNTVKKTHPDGSFEFMEYDGNGNLTGHTDAAGSKTSYEYDLMDRLCAIINVMGGRKEITYNPTGKISAVKDEGGFVTAYNYDLNQNLIQVTNAKGHSTNYKYDAMNRLTEVHQRNSCVIGNDVDEMIAQDLITAYKYNRRGLLTQEINAKSQITYYEYDATGNLIKKEDRDGCTTQFGYDSLNNLQTVKHDDGRQTDYKHDPLNRVISMLDWLGQTTYERDILGRITKVTGHNNSIVRYNRGLLGEKKGIDYPDGSKIEYTYDNMNRLSEVSFGKSKTAYTYNPAGKLAKEILPNGQISQYLYDPMHRIKALTHFDAKGDILDKREFAYDARGNKTQISIRESKPAQGDFKQLTGAYTFAYDQISQLTAITNPEGGKETYAYDHLGNRIRKTISGGSKASTQYSYDELNRLVKITGEGEELLGFNLNNAPAGTALIDYDNRGNLTRIHAGNKTIAKYTYDAADKLIHVQTHAGTTADYAYDGTGRRVRKDIGGHSYKYVLDVTAPYNDILAVSYGGHDISAHSGGSNASSMNHGHAATENFLYGSKRIGTTKGSNIQALYLHDEMGSPIRTMDMQGKSLSQGLYDAFGNDMLISKNHMPINRNNTNVRQSNTQGRQSNTQGSGINSLITFTGYENDHATGLHFVQARYYMPGIARFTSEDPNKGNVYNPPSLNAYMHCYNNPLGWVDRDGCEPTTVKEIEAEIAGLNSEILALNNNITQENANIDRLTQQVRDGQMTGLYAGSILGHPIYLSPAILGEILQDRYSASSQTPVYVDFNEDLIRNAATRLGVDYEWINNGRTIVFDGQRVSFSQVTASGATSARTKYNRDKRNNIFAETVFGNRTVNIHRINQAFGKDFVYDYIFICGIENLYNRAINERAPFVQYANLLITLSEANLERDALQEELGRKQNQKRDAEQRLAAAQREEEEAATKSNMMDNIARDRTLPASDARREAMVIMGDVLLNAGFEPAFVAGMLANIMSEGNH